MIIDDRLLNDAGASNDREGFGSDQIGSGITELNQLATDAGSEPIAPAQSAPDNADAAIDSPLGIYFRDIARIPLLTAEQEVTLAKALEAGELARASLADGVPDDPVARAEL